MKGKKRKNISVFSEHVDEIKYILELGVSITKTYEKILVKLPENKKTISYNGFYRFCKRKGII